MSKSVLICDDSLLMRKMIADCLTLDGWTVVGEACNGEEAVTQYKALSPDTVTMDIVMPGTDGLYALDHILELDQRARVVVLSALNQSKLVSEAIRRGAHDFIVKPFLPEQLHQTLNTCIVEDVTG